MSSIQWLELPFQFVSPRQVLSAGILLPVVCLALVAVRFYVRHAQKIGLGIDDWLIAFGAVMVTGIGACFITGERLGVMGYPTPVPQGTTASEASALFLRAYILLAKIQFALQILLCFAYGFIKTSVIFFCRRIFVATKQTAFDWISWTMVYISIAWSVAFLITLIFGCGKHVSVHWAPLQKLVQSGCDASTPEKAMVISDFILDLMIIILPLPMIWNLVMSTKRKLAVSAIFLVGLMSVAASAARMAIYLIVLSNKYEAGYDINRTATTMLWWSMLECSLAAIAACLPTLSFLTRGVTLKSIFSRVSGSSGSWNPWKNSARSRGSSEPSEGSLGSAAQSIRPMHSGDMQDKMAGFRNVEHRRISEEESFA